MNHAGYVYPVDSEVVRVGVTKVTIHVQRKDGTQKEVAVSPARLIPRGMDLPPTIKGNQDEQQGAKWFSLNPASAVPNANQDSVEALAAEISAEIASPCQQCGCTLYYCTTAGDMMCHWCYPRPAKYGSLSDEQRARLRVFFSRKVHL